MNDMQPTPEAKDTRKVFVIMPYTKTPTRDRQQLDAFFKNNLEQQLEQHQDFAYRYKVKRSADTFNIKEQIIKDVYEADIVLCDLSGELSNPNVMYELGVRLGTTNKPVVLFREKHPSNKLIFDVDFFHCFDYDPFNYGELEEYIVEKIKKFESKREKFESPVLATLRSNPRVTKELQLQAATGVIEGIGVSGQGLMRSISPALDDFFRENHSDLETPDVVEELIDFLDENEQELASLPWNEFNFQPTVPPSLYRYLAVFPLRGLVPERVTWYANSHIQEYFNVFFGTNHWWTPVTWIALYRFVWETFSLVRICEALNYFMTEPTDAEKLESLEYLSKLANNCPIGELVGIESLVDLMVELGYPADEAESLMAKDPGTEPTSD